MTIQNMAMAYSVKQARTLLGGVSHAFFYQLIKRQKIKVFKLGKRTLVSHSELQRLIHELETEGSL
jgi:excisionase family DNA binding protein